MLVKRVPQGCMPALASTPAVYPQLATPLSPIHTNSFPSMLTFLFHPLSITPLPSQRVKVLPLTTRPSAPSTSTAPSLLSPQSPPLGIPWGERYVAANIY